MQLKVKKMVIYLVSNDITLCLSGYSVDSLVSTHNGEPIRTCLYVCQTFTSKLDQLNWDVYALFAKELKVLSNVRERFHGTHYTCTYGI